MSEKEMQALAEQIVYYRKLRSEIEEQISRRSIELMTKLKVNKLFAPPPKGQKSPIYLTQDATTKVRLMGASQARQWHLPNDPLVLDRARSISINGMTPEELIVDATKFSNDKIKEELENGRLTEAQLRALYMLPPAKEWRVSVSATNLGGI